MSKIKNKINTWVFDLDNTLYSADSGIFQQVHVLMGEFVSKHLNINIKEAKEIQRKYYKQHGTTLRGMMDNHGVDPDYFLSEVHKLDYSIIGPNIDLNEELKILEGRKIIYTNANLQHTVDVLEKLQLTNMFTGATPIFVDVREDFNIDPESTIMFDDIAKNLVPAKNVGFTSVWIDAGYENFSDDIASSKKYLDYETKNISNFLNQVNKGEI